MFVGHTGKHRQNIILNHYYIIHLSLYWILIYLEGWGLWLQLHFQIKLYRARCVYSQPTFSLKGLLPYYNLIERKSPCCRFLKKYNFLQYSKFPAHILSKRCIAYTFTLKKYLLTISLIWNVNKKLFLLSQDISISSLHTDLFLLLYLG